jgi:hypothetical protein
VFIQIIQGKCSRQAELHAALDRWERDIAPDAPGWLGGTYGFTDDGMFVGVVRFENKEMAMANSDRPEQGRWWAETEQLFDGPVEFHNSNQVTLMMDGGSDEAGFVQIVRGKVDDPSRIEEAVRDMTPLLHAARPEIIGATLAIEDDGTFTETVAFTDEAAARANESRTMADDDRARQAMEEWRGNVHDQAYFDLHQPWFSSKA